MKKNRLLIAGLILLSTYTYSMDKAVFLGSVSYDVQNEESFDDLKRLVQADRTLLYEGNGVDVHDSVLKRIITAYDALPQDEYNARYGLLELLFRDILEIGKGDEQFEAQVDHIRGLVSGDNKYSNFLNSMKAVFPRDEDNVPAPIGQEEVDVNRFVFTQPTHAQLVDAFAYQKVMRQIYLGEGGYMEAPDSVSACSLIDPDSDEPLVCTIAREWRKSRYNDDIAEYYHGRSLLTHYLGNTFDDLVAKAQDANNQRLRAQFEPLMRLFVEDESYYDGTGYRRDAHFGGLIQPVNRDFNDFMTYKANYQNDGYAFPYAAPVINRQQINEEKTAVRTAQLFSMVHDMQIMRDAHELLARFPELKDARNIKGESILYSLIARYEDFAQEIKGEIEALFVHILCLGARTDISTDRMRFVERSVYGAHGFWERHECVWDHVGDYPSVQDLLGGSRDPDFRVSARTRERFKELVSLVEEIENDDDYAREELITRYDGISDYLPQPQPEINAEQPVVQDEDPADDEQNKVAYVLQEKEQSYFDVCKGPLKYFVVGLGIGVIGYFAQKRYFATPEELYGRTDIQDK